LPPAIAHRKKIVIPSRRCPWPLRDRLAETIIRDIKNGVYPDGQTMPTVAELARRHSRSTGVVSEALAIARQQGWVETRLTETGRRRLFARHPDSPATPSTSRANRVVLDIIARIRSRDLSVGERLPRTAELAEHYSVGRGTVERARSTLVRTGVISAGSVRVLEWRDRGQR
jgi:DNA-binding FadR family transcriptional regulator